MLGGNNMKSTLSFLITILALTGVSVAGELPDAPGREAVVNNFMVEAAIPAAPPKPAENKIVSPSFVSLAVISTASTFADSYTTLFARENWLAGKTNVCNVEVDSPYLYGTHPTVARTYAVAAAKSSASVLAAYYLRKRHSRFWSMPLIANSALSLQGVTQNMIACH